MDNDLNDRFLAHSSRPLDIGFSMRHTVPRDRSHRARHRTGVAVRTDVRGVLLPVGPDRALGAGAPTDGAVPVVPCRHHRELHARGPRRPDRRAALGDVALVTHGAGHRFWGAEPAPTPSVFDLPHDEMSEHLRGAASRWWRSADRCRVRRGPLRPPVDTSSRRRPAAARPHHPRRGATGRLDAGHARRDRGRDPHGPSGQRCDRQPAVRHRGPASNPNLDRARSRSPERLVGGVARRIRSALRSRRSTPIRLTNGASPHWPTPSRCRARRSQHDSPTSSASRRCAT